MKGSLVARIINSLLLLTLVAMGGEWGKEEALVKKYVPEKIVLTDAAIENLLQQPLTLNDCVAIALKNNVLLQIDRLEYNRVYYSKWGTRQSLLPSLSMNVQRSEAADLDSLTSREVNRTFDDEVSISLSERMPLGGSISFTRRLAWATNGNTRLTDNPGREWTISFTQPLLKGFGYSVAYSDVKLANLDYRIEQYRLQNAILSTIFLVKEAYFNVLQQQKQVAVTESAIERDRKLKELSQAKVDAKIATRRDVLSAEIILQQDFAELVNAQTELATSLDQLKNVLGISIDGEIELLQKNIEFTPLVIEEDNWMQRALENNMTLKQLEASLERIKFEQKLSGNSRMPDIYMEGTYSALDDQDLQDSRTRNWTGRVRLSYPLFNFSGRASHRRATLASEQAEKNLEDNRRFVIITVREITRNLKNSQQRLDILLKNIDASKEKVTFANTMFNLGKADNKDITDAQEDLLAAEVDYVSELAIYYIEQARLEELLGGYPIINQ